MDAPAAAAEPRGLLGEDVARFVWRTRYRVARDGVAERSIRDTWRRVARHLAAAGLGLTGLPPPARSACSPATSRAGSSRSSPAATGAGCCARTARSRSSS